MQEVAASLVQAPVRADSQVKEVAHILEEVIMAAGESALNASTVVAVAIAAVIAAPAMHVAPETAAEWGAAQGAARATTQTGC